MAERPSSSVHRSSCISLQSAGQMVDNQGTFTEYVKEQLNYWECELFSAFLISAPSQKMLTND